MIVNGRDGECKDVQIEENGHETENKVRYRPNGIWN